MGRLLPCSTQDTACLQNIVVPRMKGIKIWGKPPVHRPMSGVGLPCGKARLLRWKMVLRLVSPAWACGRPACRTAWFMRVMISAVATWINHVARIKLLLNDAQHFLQVSQPQGGKHTRDCCVVSSRSLMAVCSSWGTTRCKSSQGIFIYFDTSCNVTVQSSEGWIGKSSLKV